MSQSKRIEYLAYGAIMVLVIFAARWFSNFEGQSDSQVAVALNESAIDRKIRQLEVQTATAPTVTKPYLALAELYLQKVRDTGDVAYYQRINELIDKVESLDPDIPESFVFRVAVLNGRHQFLEAKVAANRALAQNPNSANTLGVLSDAWLELGEYQAAAEAIQRMVDLRPDFSSYSRAAYIRELYGDIAGAKEILELALSASSTFPENSAWVLVELGKLALRRDWDLAEKHFRLALGLVPNYAPALAGLGQVAAARGQLAEAIGFFKQAASFAPQAQYVILLGDAYTLLGEIDKAEAQYALARLAFENSEASGVDTDLEFAIFLADHQFNLDEALVKAEAAVVKRPSIFAYDALAWVYYQRGEIKAATEYIQKALVLGEHDPQILFHAGLIAKLNSEEDLAQRRLQKALDLHPNFSLLGPPRARQTLALTSLP